jgi:hypothetical protein
VERGNAEGGIIVNDKTGMRRRGFAERDGMAGVWRKRVCGAITGKSGRGEGWNRAPWGLKAGNAEGKNDGPQVERQKCHKYRFKFHGKRKAGGIGPPAGF